MFVYGYFINKLTAKLFISPIWQYWAVKTFITFESRIDAKTTSTFNTIWWTGKISTAIQIWTIGTNFSWIWCEQTTKFCRYTLAIITAELCLIITVVWWWLRSRRCITILFVRMIKTIVEIITPWRCWYTLPRMTTTMCYWTWMISTANLIAFIITIKFRITTFLLINTLSIQTLIFIWTARFCV